MTEQVFVYFLIILSHCNYIITIYRASVKSDLASSQNLHNPRDVEKMCATCAAIAYTPQPCHNIVTPRGERKESKTPTDLPTYSQKGTTMANITRKALTNALISFAENTPGTIDAIADTFGVAANEVTDALTNMRNAVNRPHKSKPSADTLKNKENTALLVAELNARNGEFTAAEIADMTADVDGMPMTTRKAAILLANAARAGMIDVSPEPWSVKHYAKAGYEFAKKPTRAKKNADTETATE